MWLIEFAIANPTKVAVSVLLVILFGLQALLATPVQLTPEVVEPEVTITTIWPGASPIEVEREIIEEQEEQLKSVEGLKEFKSECSSGMGVVRLKFEVGTNLADAMIQVNNKLNQVPEYPITAKKPVITRGSGQGSPIAWFILQALPPKESDLDSFLHGIEDPNLNAALEPYLTGDPERRVSLGLLARIAKQYPVLNQFLRGRPDPAEYRSYAEDFLEARLERVPGVSNANVIGGREKEFRVVIDPPRLASHNLTIGDLRRALLERNVDISGGDIWEGKTRQVIRTIGRYSSPENVADTIVAVRDNAPVFVRDVARVEINYKKPDGVVRQMGSEGIALNAEQAPGTNVLEVMGPPLESLDANTDGVVDALEVANAKAEKDSLRVAVAEANANLLEPRGLFLEQVYDQTEYIYSAQDLVEGNIYVGGTLAVIVLLVFLRDPWSVLVIGTSIPISVIGTFLFINQMGRTINVISLAGMAFAVGMVVDNSVVVLENIYRHLQMGLSVKAAVRKGTTEVWGAVLASTLTTMAVFLPIIFLEGQVGQLFKDIALAIASAVGLSLLVSITVVPCVAQMVLTKKNAATLTRPVWGLVWVSWFGSLFTNSVLGFLRFLHSSSWLIPIRIAIVALFAVVSLYGSYALAPRMEYLPEGNRNLVFAILNPPPGYNVNHMIEIGERLEEEIAPYWEARPGSPEEAALGGPRIQSFFFVARGRMLFMGARAADPLRARELIAPLQKLAATVPGVIPIVSQSSLFDQSLSGGRSIDIDFSGPDLEHLVAVGGEMFGKLQGVFPPDQGNMIRPIPGLDLSSPEVHVRPRWERAADLAVSTADMGYMVDALVDGAYAGDYWHDGHKVDLVIYGADEYSPTAESVNELPVSTPKGELITLSSIAHIKRTTGPEQVNHNERLRSITLQVKPSPGIPLGDALLTIDEVVRKPLLERPEFKGGTYQVRLTGTADKLNQTRKDLESSLILAALITYLLMAGLFESFWHPVVVMLSVAFGLVGGFLGLFLLNYLGAISSSSFVAQPLDTLTMLGFIILIGTVVNNAILIVEQALINMREGMQLNAAVLESTRSRIRPIFMTTVTTVLGMLPLVLPNPTWASGKLEWVAGAGSELYRGLGSVILGGLIVSTLFTLILIPIAFTLSIQIQNSISRVYRSIFPKKVTETEKE